MTNKEMGVLTALYALTIQKPNEGCTVEEIVTKLQEDNLYKIGSTESYGHTSSTLFIHCSTNQIICWC